MPHITTCTSCGSAYEESGEERANESERLCGTCFAPALDFTAFRHPVLAVRCPECRATHGSPCKRPSEHKAADFHGARKRLADRLFIKQHGERASIVRGSRGWVVRPFGRAAHMSLEGAS